MDLPKNPVPPMTRSVDITFYLFYQTVPKSVEASHLSRLAFLVVKTDLPDLASESGFFAKNHEPAVR